ncbi:hypothetical protein B0T25DRAFT_4894 [Lasiosphaeria hispida]|uniref:Uncharacterized protein n=1 Tax=Lasiosphaeria hispida TaxID=260671 RepID=A0AAJ0MJ32_9PEZI|nr:hypothetical protein B0T25DRAFT_4894 [Lasiosphaeria hispida]
MSPPVPGAGQMDNPGAPGIPNHVQSSLENIKSSLRQLERVGALRAAEYFFLVGSLEGFLQCWACSKHNADESASAYVSFDNRELSGDKNNTRPASNAAYKNPSTPRSQTYQAPSIFVAKHPVPLTPDTPKVPAETMVHRKDGFAGGKHEATSVPAPKKGVDDSLNRFMEAAANGGIRVAPASGTPMPTHMAAAYTWGHEPLPRENWIDAMAFYKGEGLKGPYKRSQTQPSYLHNNSVVMNNPEIAWDKIKEKIAANNPDLPRADDPAFHWPAGHFYGMENFKAFKELGTPEFLGQIMSNDPAIRFRAEHQMMKAGWKGRGVGPVGMPMPPYARNPKAPHRHSSVYGLDSNDAAAPGHGVGARMAGPVGPGITAVNAELSHSGYVPQAMGAAAATGAPAQRAPYIPAGFDVVAFANMNPCAGHNTRPMPSIHSQSAPNIPANATKLPATPKQPVKVEPNPLMRAGLTKIQRAHTAAAMAAAAT